MLLATRCMVGIGEASYSAIALTLIADLFVPEKRIRVLAVYFVAIPIGRYIYCSIYVHQNLMNIIMWFI